MKTSIQDVVSHLRVVAREAERDALNMRGVSATRDEIAELAREQIAQWERLVGPNFTIEPEVERASVQ